MTFVDNLCGTLCFPYWADRASPLSVDSNSGVQRLAKWWAPDCGGTNHRALRAWLSVWLHVDL